MRGEEEERGEEKSLLTAFQRTLWALDEVRLTPRGPEAGKTMVEREQGRGLLRREKPA